MGNKINDFILFDCNGDAIYLAIAEIMAIEEDGSGKYLIRCRNEFLYEVTSEVGDRIIELVCPSLLS